MTPTIYHVNTHKNTKTKRCPRGLLSVPVHTLQQEGSTVGAVDIVRQLAKPAYKSSWISQISPRNWAKKPLPGLPRKNWVNWNSTSMKPPVALFSAESHFGACFLPAMASHRRRSGTILTCDGFGFAATGPKMGRFWQFDHVWPTGES
jgi:hypothetical protein